MPLDGKHHVYQRVSFGGDSSWPLLRKVKKLNFKPVFFYSLTASFWPESNSKKFKIPVTRPNVLGTAMRNLVMIELTVVN